MVIFTHDHENPKIAKFGIYPKNTIFHIYPKIAKNRLFSHIPQKRLKIGYFGYFPKKAEFWEFGKNTPHMPHLIPNPSLTPTGLKYIFKNHPHII